jgi:antitoxin component YwqK of YwqJK toxin-antitoxin module
MQRNLLILLFLILPAILSAQTYKVVNGDTINRTDAKGLKQGVWKKFYVGTGELMTEGTFKDGVPTGVFKNFYKDGKLQATRTYYENGKTYLLQGYHPNAKIKVTGIATGEAKDSLWKYYNEEGVLVSEENYIEGKKNGVWKTYYPNGKPVEEVAYKNDKKEGAWKYFFDDGKVKTEGNYVNDELEGQVRHYYPSGLPRSMGRYKKSQREGEWIYYNDDGSIHLREEYKEGRLVKETKVSGVFTTYYPNNIPKEEITWKKGMKNGPFTVYYEAGQWVQEIKKGENGFPDEKEEKLTGQKVRMKGNYLNDRLDGAVTYYKMDGSVEKTETYKDGVLVK